MSKYNCRGCPVQERCIDQCDRAIHIKEIIRNAFAARTDTVSTWNVLQKNCLLIKEDEAHTRRAREGSLSARLRKARTTEEELNEAPVEETPRPTDQAQPISLITPLSPEPTAAVTSTSCPPPVSPSSPAQVEAPASKVLPTSADEVLSNRLLEPSHLSQQPTLKCVRFHWLIINDSQRRISLPINGELVLGRFDPHTNSPLDVDLTYEDRNMLTVSRRHAKIVGVDGHHTIEDLGSSNGLFINKEQVTPARAHPLRSGDCISLGGLQMRYDRVPSDFLDTFPIKMARVRRFLFLTHTGRKVVITPPNNIIIGRSDFATNFVPSVDLSQEGEVATRVSRRHARIIWNNYDPCLKDLQSTFGIRLNGEVLLPHQAVLLKPGDHISLGGCVLAYDIAV